MRSKLITILILVAAGALAIGATNLVEGLKLTSNADANGYQITGLGTPTNSSNAATLGYVTNEIATAASNYAPVAHVSATNNPHSVTATQVGLGNVEDVALSTWAGSTNLTTTAVGTLGTAATNASGDFAPVAHISATNNPHTVTAAQVGLGSVEDTALSTWPGSTNLTTTAVGTLGTAATNASGDFAPVAHVSATNNPHTVTAAQVGLGSVENTALSTWAGSTNLTTTAVGTLGTAATNAASAFATSAQGALADTAVQPTRTISTTAPITGGGNLTANLTLAISSAATNAVGAVQLATDAEIQTGTDTAKAVRSSGLAAWWTWVKTQAQSITAIWTFPASIEFEGATADAYETTLTVTDPTADRTITLPNATGTVLTTGSVLDSTLVIASFPPMTLGSTGQFANNGTWSNWTVNTTSSWVTISKQQAASTAAGWARCGFYNFCLNTGEASNTPTGRPFVFSFVPNLPGDSSAIGLALDIYFGSQLTEQGGALTARGLRVQIKGNSATSNYLITAGIHDGSTETTATGTSSDIGAGSTASIIIRWLPVGGATPGAGSTLTVYQRAASSNTLTTICTVTLSGSIGATSFAGSSIAFVASSAGTTPGYTANWELGGIRTYRY